MGMVFTYKIKAFRADQRKAIKIQSKVFLRETPFQPIEHLGFAKVVNPEPVIKRMHSRRRFILTK